jgi:hypothetical protein
MRRAMFIVLSAVVLAGCGPSVKFFPMNEPPDYTIAERIEVVSDFPTRPYVELGIIKVKARVSFLSSPEKMMRLLKERAVAVGADAIVVEGLSVEQDIDLDHDGLDVSNKDVVTAIAIAWL